LEQNNISVLNVAGNRGSKIGNMRDSVVATLKEGLTNQEKAEEESPIQDREARL
jgi:hypothetical protein